MRHILFGLSLVFANLIIPVAYAYEPSRVAQCIKQTPKQSSLQNLVHEVDIQIDQGERKCKDINGEWGYDCRTPFFMNIVNKGFECGFKGSKREAYEAYKKKAYQAYSFGGFELHGYRNGKKVRLPLDCTGLSFKNNIVAGADHCFKNHDNDHLPDLYNRGQIYYKYRNRNGKIARVRLSLQKTRSVGPTSDGLILFKTVGKIERDHFFKLPPRGTTHNTLQSIIDKKQSMEIVSEVNKDWIKVQKEKGKKNPRNQLHSKCTPGQIAPNKYSLSMVSHACDTSKGSSGAPLITEVNLCSPHPTPPTLLGVQVGVGDYDNMAVSMSGSNLEEIYKFIDEVK